MGGVPLNRIKISKPGIKAEAHLWEKWCCGILREVIKQWFGI